ncbi:hypothetical protein ACFXPS_43830 [Nocardia sp. NPDC059091]|uniref:hypothetical protein n=1 Tax=Nocardia sp. NPDC059091 TaxID=3346724 RepID=UPI003685EF00
MVRCGGGLVLPGLGSVRAWAVGLVRRRPGRSDPNSGPDGRRLCELLGDDGQIFHIGAGGGGVQGASDAAEWWAAYLFDQLGYIVCCYLR